MKFGTREILFLLLLVAIPIGSWVLVFHPRDQKIEEAKQEILAKRAKLNSLNRATSSMKSLESEIKQYNEAIAFFRSKLPQEKEMDQVLGEVWKLAQTSNLNVTGVRTISRVGNNTVSLIDPGGPYAEQPVRLQLEGDFNEALYSFLLALEKRPRITRIQKMQVEKVADAISKGEPKAEGKVKADIEMSVFFERSTGEE
jgi:type IV pilus assembly protein PilO